MDPTVSVDALIAGGHRKAVALNPRGEVHLHAMVTSAGYERCGPDYCWDGRRRGDQALGILQYTLAGAGQLDDETGRHRLLPGQAMLVTVPGDHRYLTPPDGVWEHCYICFNGREALRLGALIRSRCGPVLAIGEQPDTLAALVRLVTTVIDQPAGPLRHSAMLYDLLLRLLAWTDDPVALPAEVARAQRYGRRHYAEEIGVEDLARAAGLSRYHFSRVFKDHTGQSPWQWLCAERLAAACRLLATDLSITDIAARCGFNGPGYFAKVFRRHYGLTPSAFRRREMR